MTRAWALALFIVACGMALGCSVGPPLVEGKQCSASDACPERFTCLAGVCRLTTADDGGCAPTGPEACDGIDNDCDGLVDVLPPVSLMPIATRPNHIAVAPRVNGGFAVAYPTLDGGIEVRGFRDDLTASTLGSRVTLGAAMGEWSALVPLGPGFYVGWIERLPSEQVWGAELDANLAPKLAQTADGGMATARPISAGIKTSAPMTITTPLRATQGSAGTAILVWGSRGANRDFPRTVAVRGNTIFDQSHQVGNSSESMTSVDVVATPAGTFLVSSLIIDGGVRFSSAAESGDAGTDEGSLAAVGPVNAMQLFPRESSPFLAWVQTDADVRSLWLGPPSSTNTAGRINAYTWDTGAVVKSVDAVELGTNDYFAAWVERTDSTSRLMVVRAGVRAHPAVVVANGITNFQIGFPKLVRHEAGFVTLVYGLTDFFNAELVARKVCAP